MSRIYFRTPSTTVEVYGTERHYMGHVINEAALPLLDAARDAERLAPLLPPDRQPPQASVLSEEMARWAGNLRLSLSVGFREPFTWRGHQIESFALLLNTAMTTGPGMRLTARLHAQCEMHAWVDGPNRGWLADLVDESLRAGTFRPDAGWDDVTALLRARDDGPVVTYYSVTESFPNPGVAGWSPPPMPDGWKPCWADSPKGLAEWERDYPTAADREARYEDDAGDMWYEIPDAQAAVADPQWMTGFLGWLRGDANMRSASVVGALEAARAMVAAKLPGARPIVASVLQRADEPGEALAYWTSRYGRTVPKPVKRGIADAVERLYTEYALLKYDTASKGYRFGDVLDLVHPAPAAPWQGALFRYALDRRHNRDLDEQATRTSLPMVYANAALRGAVGLGRTDRLLDPVELKAAGMTWEDALSLAGPTVDKAALWSALIPSMGYMALLRNLRNFDQAGVPDDVVATVAARLADPEQVAKSRQFPFRFLAAYRAAPSLRWGHALDRALTASLTNVPVLAGRTLVLVDRSGSMFGRMSAKSELTSADAAAVFGSAVALRNVGRTDLVQFGSGSAVVATAAGDSLLRVVERFGNMGGTETAAQAWQGYGDPAAAVPASVPVYTWNLVGYQHGHGPGAPLRHTFAGLTDAAFRMVPFLEAGRNATWPWGAENVTPRV